MAEIINLRKNPHEEVQELLPWFVNGTLDASEASRVETHLASCPDCRAELDAERRLAAAVASTPVDAQSGWGEINKRLDASGRRAIFRRRGVWQRRVPIGWAVATPFAAAAAMALLFVNITPHQAVEPQYRALGTPTPTATANVIVQFHPKTQLGDVQHLLGEVDARVVDGPTVTGAYLLRVNDAKRELALKALRDDRAIALAEPIDGPPRP